MVFWFDKYYCPAIPSKRGIDCFTQFDVGFFWQLMLVFFFLIFCLFLFENLFSFQSILFFYLKKILSQMSSIFGMSMVMIVSIFFIVLSSNLVSLIPCGFSMSSMLTFMLWGAISMYITILASTMRRGLIPFLSFFIVSGASWGMSLVIMLFEIVSSLVRPLTLSLRLVANIVAGHVLLFFVSSISVWGCLFTFVSPNSNWISKNLSEFNLISDSDSFLLWLVKKLIFLLSLLFFFSLIALNLFIKLFFCSLTCGFIMFELFVCLIQAVVFSLLLFSYLQESL